MANPTIPGAAPLPLVPEDDPDRWALSFDLSSCTDDENWRNVLHGLMPGSESPLLKYLLSLGFFFLIGTTFGLFVGALMGPQTESDLLKLAIMGGLGAT